MNVAFTWAPMCGIRPAAYGAFILPIEGARGSTRRSPMAGSLSLICRGGSFAFCSASARGGSRRLTRSAGHGTSQRGSGQSGGRTTSWPGSSGRRFAGRDWLRCDYTCFLLPVGGEAFGTLLDAAEHLPFHHERCRLHRNHSDLAVRDGSRKRLRLINRVFSSCSLEHEAPDPVAVFGAAREHPPGSTRSKRMRFLP